MSAPRKNRSLERVEPQTYASSPTRFRKAVLIACALTFAIVGSATAQGENLLSMAKQAGQVGEKLDGYIELIDQSAPENIKKMVKDTNQRRLDRYGSIAKQRGTTVESVGMQAGAKIVERAQPGEMIQTADGKWVKK